MEILVVDDEMPIVELIKYNLRKEGFSVITADNGATALRYVREKNPDLIILDLMLPDMSGYEICKTIKDNPTTTKPMVPPMHTAVAAASEPAQNTSIRAFL